ncbi:MAG: sensor histidine kinase [Desulfobacteraceae bacterium]|nr:MAG: sensor histidine kinase [Desulfobacteraceae bacterium]
MRRPLYSLRTGVLVQIVFLIIAAMMLMNIAMVMFSERDLIKAKIQSGRLCVLALEQYLGPHLQEERVDLNSDTLFQTTIARLLETGGFRKALVLDKNGKVFFGGEDQNPLASFALTQARESLVRETWLMEFWGSTWGVIWLSRESLQISAPIFWQGRMAGAVSLNGPLVPIYQTIRQTEKVFILYILFYSVILSFVGFLLLSRSVVRPIDRLLKMTNAYEAGGPPLFLPEMTEHNEIGQLTASLNNMLQRLDQNKKELQTYILSLEKANEKLQKAQADLIRSEKLASVGRLAAGIAHEIGNPIGIVLGYVELLAKGDIAEEEKKDFLQRIEHEITRISQTIRQLLDFSRPAGSLKQDIHLHDIIRATVEMLAPQPLAAGVQFDLRLTTLQDRVLADPNQLQQVCLNIILNAADALNRQEAFYKTGLAASGTFRKKLMITSGHRLDQVVLEFSDNGPGVPDAHLTQIFDPFYTTKEPGQGTGLGLAVCHQIITGLGGAIWAENNQAGEGLSIFIALPVSVPDANCDGAAS